MRMLRDLIEHSGLSSPGVQTEKFNFLNTMPLSYAQYISKGTSIWPVETA